MDADNLIIGLGGIVLSVMMYFAGVVRERRRNREDRQWQEKQRAEDQRRMDLERAATARDARITKVVDEYSRLAHGSPRIAAQYHGLLLAGIRSLDDDSETREVISRLEKRWGMTNHPLGREHEQVKALPDMHAYFAGIDPKLRNLGKVMESFGIKPS